METQPKTCHHKNNVTGCADCKIRLLETEVAKLKEHNSRSFYDYAKALPFRAWRLEGAPTNVTDEEFASLVAQWDKCWGSTFFRPHLTRPVDIEARQRGQCTLYVIRAFNDESELLRSLGDTDEKIPAQDKQRMEDFVRGFFVGLRSKR